MSEVRRYRKKPVVNEAVQWDGINATAQVIRQWSANAVRDRPSQQGYLLTIETLEGLMTARPGDWIIKDAGGFYPCKPDIFAATYEAAE